MNDKLHANGIMAAVLERNNGLIRIESSVSFIYYHFKIFKILRKYLLNRPKTFGAYNRQIHR